MKFSLIVPTRDRPEKLASCIAAINALTPIADPWELVIVDDGSAPAVQHPENSTAPAKLVRATGRGPAAARNAGARAANGEVLVFVDDDCRAENNLLAALNRVYANHPTALVGGQLVHGTPENFWSTVTHVVTQASYAIQEQHARAARRFSTSLLAVPRAGFLELGGFDEQFGRPGGEDYEFCERWHASGRPALFTTSASVIHFHPLTFNRFVRQHRNYGSGLARAHLRQRNAPSGRPLLAKLGDVLAIVLWPLRNGGNLRLSAGALLAQACTAWGAATALIRPERETPQTGGQ